MTNLRLHRIIVNRRISTMKINEVILKELRFKGYACTKDCSGHLAGYNWAKARNIKNPNQCPIDGSNSFTEGCYAYAKEK